MSDPSQLYYQILFRVLGFITMKTAYRIVHNHDKDVLTDKIRWILQTVPVFLLALPIYSARLLIPFCMTNLTFTKVLKSTFYLEPKIYSKTIAPCSPKYITATKTHNLKAAIDQLINTMSSAIDKKRFADIKKYKKKIAVW